MQVAVVTGCANGIGREVALALLGSGWRVYGVDLEAATDLPIHELIIGDVTSEALLISLADILRAGPGHVNALVNCAGLIAVGVERPFPPLPEVRFEDMLQMFRVNTWAPVLACQVLLDLLRRGAATGASVVNVISDIVYQTCARQLPYVVSKGALLAATRGLARELGADGIRVNGVAPGLCMTPRTKASPFLQSVAGPVREARSIRRDLPPHEVASAIVYLVSPQAAGITGQVLPVNLGHVFA